MHETKQDLNLVRRWGVTGTTTTNQNSVQVGNPRDPIAEAARLLETDKNHRSLQADQILMLRMVMPQLTAGLGQLSAGINRWMNHQGFWQSDNKGEKIALMHSELSEALEAIRKGDRANEAEELADTLIRILDYCGQFNIDLGQAVERKMLVNYARPFKHNKAF